MRAFTMAILLLVGCDSDDKKKSPGNTAIPCTSEGAVCTTDGNGLLCLAGTCQCAAFAAAGCAADEWCLPGATRDVSGSIPGTCTPDTGTAVEGDSCGGATGCAAGMECLDLGLGAHCITLCDPQAA